MTNNRRTAVDFERALVAAAVTGGPQAVAAAVGTMPTDFADRNLAGVWRMILDMDAAGLPYTDPVVLLAQMAMERFDAAYRSPLFVSQLVGEGMAAHAKYYGQQIREAARKRKLVRIAVELSERATHETEDAAAIRRWLDGELMAIGEDVTEQHTFHEAGQQLLADLRRPKEGAAARVAVSSGIPSVDMKNGAMVGGELVILAARPRMGKTALATQIAFNAALDGRRVLFLSLEMSQTELAMRVLSGLAGVNSTRFRSDAYTDEHVSQLESELGRYEELPLTIWAPTRSGVTVPKLRAAARLFASQGNFGLLVVDYLQLLDATAPDRVRTEQVAEMTKGLKQIAREFKVPVLCLAQLNRTAETEGTPRLGHLRESGSIEQDADTVLFITRELTNTDATLHVAKHRAGNDGTIDLDFDRVKTRFHDRGYLAGSKAVRCLEQHNHEDF